MIFWWFIICAVVALFVVSFGVLWLGSLCDDSQSNED